MARPRTDTRHPLFARMWPGISRTADRRGASEHRRRLLGGARGVVVEVGAGDGANFEHYPDTVAEVIAVEPEPFLRRRAERAARRGGLPVRVVAGSADALPLDDASADVVVASLVLCSVPDQGRALAEMRRVLRPDGELRFYEHVVADGAVTRGFQRFAQATFWPRMFGNCHPARDTEAAIVSAGFEPEEVDRFPFRASLLEPAMPHVLGRARRP